MTAPAPSLGSTVAPSPARVFGLLAREALADATRRRIVPLIAAMALLSLFFVNTCTSCSADRAICVVQFNNGLCYCRKDLSKERT